MNNQDLIVILNRDHLLSVVELLSRALMLPGECIREIADEELYYDLPYLAVSYCANLSDYQRLKLMQEIINALVVKAEKPTVPSFQLLLPSENKHEATLNTVLPNY